MKCWTHLTTGYEPNALNHTTLATQRPLSEISALPFVGTTTPHDGPSSVYHSQREGTPWLKVREEKRPTPSTMFLKIARRGKQSRTWKFKLKSLSMPNEIISFECATQETRRRDELSQSPMQSLKSQLRQQPNAFFVLIGLFEKPKLDNARKLERILSIRMTWSSRIQ